MKKLLTLALIVLTAVTLCLSGCKKDPIIIEEDDSFIVTVYGAKDNTTLADYMLSLDDYKDKLVISNGMVISINGVANNDLSMSYWMLYTNDADMANISWGTCEYNGETYGSAIVGIEELIVKNGSTYIWHYQSFSL